MNYYINPLQPTVYIASPYSGYADKEDAVHVQIEAFKVLTANHFSAYAPLVHGHHLGLDISDTFWYEKSVRDVDMYGAIVILKKEGIISEGVRLEHSQAQYAGLEQYISDSEQTGLEKIISAYQYEIKAFRKQREGLSL